MVANKDFKRLVRARMGKTGESYTAARAHLAAARPVPRPAPPATRRAVSPAEYAAVAGMSDAAVRSKTGCTWASWVRTLDHHGADAWPHGAIAEYIRDKYDVSPWWTQMVTVGYERIRGLRERGQRRDGRFEASKSKVFAVPVSRLYRAFHDRRTRERWLADASFTVRKATPNRSLRLTWSDGTSVEAWFTARGAAKSQVQVQHVRLADQAAAVHAKAYWSERLDALGAVLTPGRRRKTVR